MPTINFGKYYDSDLDTLTDVDYLGWILTQDDGRAGDFAAWYGYDIRARIRNIPAEQGAAAAARANYTLHPSQAAAADAVERELLRGDATAYRIDGGAGYGKSFVTREIVTRAMLHGYAVRACATSYVASQVLDQQLAGICEAGTIASTCRLAKVRSEDVESYTVDSKSLETMHALLNPSELPRLLVVDEGSMVGDEVAVPLLDIARRTGGKLLIVGDRYQLPPVGQDHASPFYRLDGAVELREPMRFSRDSDLFTVEQVARFDPRGIFNLDLPESDEVRWHSDQHGLVSHYLDALREYPNDDCRMLFFRRDDVAFANQAIRARRYGPEAESTPLVDGERFLVLETTDVGRDTDDEQGHRIYSGQTFQPESLRTDDVHGIQCPVARVRGVGDVPLSFAGSETAAALQRKLTVLRAQVRDSARPEKWADFYRVKNAFLPVGYPYAMTVHRCQGQTVDRAYFDPRRLQGRMGAALTYVAATRASSQINVVR